MNPVIPITAKKFTRSALFSLGLLAGYRIVKGRYPSPREVACANAVLVAALSYELTASFYGQWSFGYPGLVTKMPTVGRFAALTFDDGPSEEFTPRLLDILDHCGVRATFFMLGERAERLPHLVQETISRGHTVAPHGFHHVALPTKSMKFIRHQIRNTLAALGPSAVPYFRPPHGFKSYGLLRACSLEHVSLTTWSINPKDYFNPAPQELTQRVLNSLHEGAIILLHEWSESTLLALPDLVKQCRNDYGFDLACLPASIGQAPDPTESCLNVRK